MKIVAIKTFLLSVLLFTLSYAQDDKSEIGELNDCPPHYTHSVSRNPEIKIQNIEVRDSNNYTSLPSFKLDINFISNLFHYPEIALRADIEGSIVIELNIDSTGIVTKHQFHKGVGAGIDESAVDGLLKSKFKPAEMNNKKAPSVVIVTVAYHINKITDKPEYEFDEIRYEVRGMQLYYIKVMIFAKDGGAYLSEDRGYKDPEEWKGKLPYWYYTKLNDFIISQCFFDYNDEYVSSSPQHAPRTVITIKKGDLEKSVTSQGKGYDPIGFWVLTKLIQKIQDEIKWEEIE